MRRPHRERMHWLTHPWTILIAALTASVVGVIGESIDGSAIVHLASVACVVVGLVVVVLTIPGFDEHDSGDV
jgi:hypothetical protein